MKKQPGQEVGLNTSDSITGTGQGRYRPSSSSEQEHDWFMEHFQFNTMEPRIAFKTALNFVIIMKTSWN